jgi:hypothetical protein
MPGTRVDPEPTVREEHTGGEVGIMSADVTSKPGTKLVTVSFLMPLVYLVWFFPAFALGYWVTSIFGAYPTTGDAPMLYEMGVAGWLASLAYGLVVGWPSWTGVVLALMGRRRGAGRSALAAVGINAAMGLFWVVTTFLP